MFKKFLSLLLVACAIFGPNVRAEDVGILHLRPLHLIFPPTWTFDGSRNPIEGKGPDGEKVLVTVMKRRGDGASSSPASAKDLANELAGNRMPLLAAKGGHAVVRPVTPLATPEGKVGFSAASEKSGLFNGEQYFVQYLLASDSALIYLTVEGKGKALAVTERFDGIMETQQWDE